MGEGRERARDDRLFLAPEDTEKGGRDRRKVCKENRPRAEGLRGHCNAS